MIGGMGLAGAAPARPRPVRGSLVHHATRGLTMKKLRLNTEELRVESFPTAAVIDETGTVHGNVGTLALPSCPVQVCHTYDDTLCGLSRGCGD